jgi:predicted nucleic acid-binding protein
MLDDHEVGQEGAMTDALHLALAAERGLIMCTLDRRLATAAASLGQAVVVP